MKHGKNWSAWLMARGAATEMKMDYKKYVMLARNSAKNMGKEIAKGVWYHHYSSIPGIFSILDSDELWLSNIRFSNDSTEEMLLGDRREARDDFVTCFSENGNLLSQWRGYCPYGGASICFYMKTETKFSILWNDYEKSYGYEFRGNRPLPVIYFNEDAGAGDAKLFRDFIKSEEPNTNITVNDIWPYVKNGYFWEERESRIVFQNGEGDFNHCIRFRTLETGVKVPYIVVKNGDIGKMSGKSLTDPSKLDETKLQEFYNKHVPIYVEEGTDQDEICTEIRKTSKKITKNRKNELPILCRGHLPIISIMVSPSPDQERLVEEIRRFCRSKYWLRDVLVEGSNIPYISSLKK